MTVKLSETEIKVGFLYFINKLSPREIASRLNLSVNTVYKAVSKVRSRLRELGIDPDRESREKLEEAFTLIQSSIQSSPDRARQSKTSEDMVNESLTNHVDHVDSNSTQKLTQESGIVLPRQASELEREHNATSRILQPQARVLTYNITFDVSVTLPLIAGQHSRCYRYEGSLSEVIPDMFNLVVKQLESLRGAMLEIRDYIGKLVEVTQRLVEELKLLNTLAQSGKLVISSGFSSGTQEGSPQLSSQGSRVEDTSIPDFIRDNVWVDIIRSKYSNT